MKRHSIILVAVFLIVGLSSCKKEEIILPEYDFKGMYHTTTPLTKIKLLTNIEKAKAISGDDLKDSILYVCCSIALPETEGIIYLNFRKANNDEIPSNIGPGLMPLNSKIIRVEKYRIY